MPQLLLTLLLFLAIGFAVAIPLSRRSGKRAPLASRIVVALSGTAIAAFCAFGFVASAEAGPHAFAWRAAYGAAGVLAAICAARSLRLSTRV